MKTQLLICTAAAVMAGAVRADTHYVNVNNPSAAAPYTNWATAAQQIQQAVDAASSGDSVLVANGIYNTGGRVTPGGGATNRVFIAKQVTVRSVNGPSKTVIVGGRSDYSVVRGVYMSAGTIEGFKISNAYVYGFFTDMKGGGVAMYGSAVASNCIIVRNYIVYGDGGGAYLAGASVLRDSTIVNNSCYGHGGGVQVCGGALVYDCLITRNSASSDGGGAYLAGMACVSNCSISYNSADSGGGVYYAEDASIYGSHIQTNKANVGAGAYFYQGGIMAGSRLAGNSASTLGGGAYCFYGGMLKSCLVTGNLATNGGGGIRCYGGAQILNCTVARNRSVSSISCGGVDSYKGTVHNTIVYLNTGSGTYPDLNMDTKTVCRYSCSPKLVSGVNGNIVQNPTFVSTTDFRLQSSSPCRNAGCESQELLYETDVAGAQRVMGSHVDMGAYEYSEATVPFILDDPWPNCVVNRSFEYQIRTRSAAQSYSASALPAGLFISQTTGTITGTPTTIGNNAVTLRASNSAGTSSATFDAPVYGAMMVTSASLKESVRTSVKSESDEGERWSYRVMQGKGIVLMRGAGDVELEMADIADTDLVVLTYGGTRMELPFGQARKTDTGAKWEIPPKVKGAGKSGARILASLSCSKGKVKFALVTIGTNWLALARQYIGKPAPVIRTAAEASLAVGLYLSAHSAVLVKGVSVVKTKHVGGVYGDDFDLPSVSLKPVKHGQAGLVIISSEPVACTAAGSPFAYRITATGNPTNFTATGRPEWLGLDAHAGTLSGLPDEAGIHRIRLEAFGRDGKDAAQLLLVVLDATPLETSFASLSLREMYAVRLKGYSERDGKRQLLARQIKTSRGETYYDTIECGATRMTMQAPWDKPDELDFTVLANEVVEINAGGLYLGFKLSESMLTASKATWVEEYSRTKVTLRQHKGILAASITSRTPDSQVAASNYAGEDNDNISDTVDVSVQIGRALVLNGSMAITGKAMVKQKTVGGRDNQETYDLPQVSIKGELAPPQSTK